jgi:hypothetical protein
VNDVIEGVDFSGPKNYFQFQKDTKRARIQLNQLSQQKYSRPPNTELPSVFGFNLMLVPDIRPVISLDRFGMNKIFSI